jgi:pimeloyl-ACP methyl ester carboxylesterase
MSMPTPYRPFFPPRSSHVALRGLNYHFLHWGRPDGKILFLLHGWMDCAATFQFLVDEAHDALREYHWIAPDWRGFGQTDWASTSYWFPDYLADLDAMIRHFSPDKPVDMVGHSMGGIIACLYAGIRPESVRCVVSLEGFGLAATTPDQASPRLARWLDELGGVPESRPMANMAAVTARLCKNNPRLSPAKAAWLAPYLAMPTEEGVFYRADPRHKWANPVLYRLDEAMATWRQITARALWLAGDETALLKWLHETPDDFARRKSCIARLTYAALPECGHNLHHDAPSDVAQRIAVFLAT